MRFLLPLLLLSAATVGAGAGSGSGARSGASPIEKRVRWFINANAKQGLGNPLNTDFLLGARGSGVAHGIYPMDGCGILPNGTLAPSVPDPAYKRYSSAGLTVMPCFGGSMLPRAAYGRRHEFAAEVLAWVLKYNMSGITLDWESHGDGGGDQYEFSAVWEAVADLLHAHGRTIGICIETGSPNVTHPWVPRTLPNDTTWHSYIASYPTAD